MDDSEGRDRTGRRTVRSGQAEIPGGDRHTPTGCFIALSPIRQKGGKIVHAWAFEGDCDPTAIVSNTFTMEWPPKSGRRMAFPERDRADFFGVAEINSTGRRLRVYREAVAAVCCRQRRAMSVVMLVWSEPSPHCIR
jgi:predicted NUDIX family NTP pyrophosphohydrolase